jgi:hypothetical protein
LQADRVSTHHLASNQLRLWEGMFAYLLLERLRTQGLSGTELERRARSAQLFVGFTLQMSSAYPLQEFFGLFHRRVTTEAVSSKTRGNRRFSSRYAFPLEVGHRNKTEQSSWED